MAPPVKSSRLFGEAKIILDVNNCMDTLRKSKAARKCSKFYGYPGVSDKEGVKPTDCYQSSFENYLGEFIGRLLPSIKARIPSQYLIQVIKKVDCNGKKCLPHLVIYGYQIYFGERPRPDFYIEHKIVKPSFEEGIADLRTGEIPPKNVLTLFPNNPVKDGPLMRSSLQYVEGFCSQIIKNAEVESTFTPRHRAFLPEDFPETEEEYLRRLEDTDRD
jgi:hypothetical protein